MGILEQLGIKSGDSDIRYGDVPFGLRLALAAQAASALDKGQVADVSGGMATMAQLQQMALERRKADALTQKQQDMANRLADKIEATNPTFADALRADPTLVDEYMKQEMSGQQWQKQYDVQRKDTLSDFAAQQEAATKAAQIKRQQELEDLRVKNEQAAALELQKHQYDMKKQDDAQEADRLKYEAEQALKNAPIIAQNNTIRSIQQSIPNKPAQGPLRPGEASPSLGYVPNTSNVPMTGDPSQDLWRGMFNTQNITPEEARRLALAAQSGSSVLDEYGKVKDDREKVQKTQAIDTPKLPQGYNWTNPDAAAKGDFSAGMTVIPGSKEEMVLKEDAAKKAKAEQKKAVEKSAYGRSLKRAIQLIDAGERGDTLPAAGIGGLWRMFPETASMSLASELTTITGNLGLDKLQAMREAAAAAGGTGASGLGSVTDYENRLLQSTIEALNQNEDPATLRERLVRLDNMVEDVVDGTLMKNTEILRQLDPSSPTFETHMKEFDEMYGVGAAEAALAEEVK